ncbi:MAG: hypothetical protein LCI00_14485 [Chloroflexi bacterium]|nr:hypothetical protein [Chloroflexota bacterium]MCC6892554.1 hypothetical protein [Anaerolineae bacterium]
MKLKLTLIAAVLLIVGCTPDMSDIATITPPVENFTGFATSPAGTPEPAVPMTTHVDETSGIAFDYPTGWSIVEPNTEGALIYSYSIASFNIDNRGTVPDGQTKMDINFFSVDDTLDTARAALQADVDSGMAVITNEETRTAADGSTAYYYTINGTLGGTARMMYSLVNGRVISVVAYGAQNQFEAVAASLQKTDE